MSDRISRCVTDKQRTISRRTVLALGGAIVAGTAGCLTEKEKSDERRSRATHYVAPDGDDSNPGTETEPFATLSAGVDISKPGDVTYLRGGTYQFTDRVVVSDTSGTSAAPIRVLGYPDERPVLRWDTNREAGGIRLDGVTHWLFGDFEISGSPTKGIQLLNPGTTNNVVRGLRVSDCVLTGVEILDGRNNLVVDVESFNNDDSQSGGENADGFKIAGRQSTGNVIRACSAHDNADDGFDLWTSRNNRVERCLSLHNGRESNGDGFGFKLGGATSGIKTGGHTVIRCVAFGNREQGFSSNGSTIPITCYNNTAYGNPSNFSIHGAQHELVNNLSWRGAVNIADTVDSRYNSWDIDISTPMFVSTVPTSADFLHLTSSSPAVDAGTDVGLQFEGDAPDLGAFER